MQQKLIILLIIPTYIYAVYNPFFTEIPASNKQKNIQSVIPVKPDTPRYKPVPTAPRKSIKMTYFGFIESNKGEYALVGFNDKNIILQVNDSLYDDEQVYKIRKVTSNYIVLKDNIGRAETVYFSSEEQTR